MSSRNSKYYKKSMKRNKVVSHILEKFLNYKRNENRLSARKTAVMQPANSQLDQADAYTASKC